MPQEKYVASLESCVGKNGSLDPKKVHEIVQHAALISEHQFVLAAALSLSSKYPDMIFAVRIALYLFDRTWAVANLQVEANASKIEPISANV